MERRDDEAPFPREPWQRLLGESRDGPPETTDARIRAAARRALAPRSRRWWLPASLAASVVLAVLIVSSEFDTIRRPVVTESAVPGDPALDARRGEQGAGPEADKAGLSEDAAPPRAAPARKAASDQPEEATADIETPASPSAQRELAAPGAAAAPAPSSAKVASAESAEPVMLPPETWYARIREMFAEGRRAEAERELEALRKAYPDWATKNVKADELR